MYPAMMNPLDRDLPMRPVSRHRSDVVGCAQRSERSARRIARPIPSVLASDATPRCASMASADRQMIGDATLAPQGFRPGVVVSSVAQRLWLAYRAGTGFTPAHTPHHRPPARPPPPPPPPAPGPG